jgi:hypothetical protein
MFLPCDSAARLSCWADSLHRRRYGTIVAQDGLLQGIRLRLLPCQVSLPRVWLAQQTVSWRQGDYCRLLYDQPWGHDAYLTVKYLEGGAETTLSTLCAALAALDEIARLKGSDALLCQAKHPRLSDRLMLRAGWQRHALSLPGRNYIRRYYGEHATRSQPQEDCRGAYCQEQFGDEQLTASPAT